MNGRKIIYDSFDPDIARIVILPDGRAINLAVYDSLEPAQEAIIRLDQDGIRALRAALYDFQEA